MNPTGIVMMVQIMKSHLGIVSNFQSTEMNTLPPASQAVAVLKIGISGSLKVSSKHLPNWVCNPKQCVPPSQFLLAIPPIVVSRRNRARGRPCLRVDDVDQANVARSRAQSHEETHDHQLLIRFDESSTKREKSPKHFCCRKVVIRSTDIVNILQTSDSFYLRKSRDDHVTWYLKNHVANLICRH